MDVLMNAYGVRVDTDLIDGRAVHRWDQHAETDGRGGPVDRSGQPEQRVRSWCPG